MKIYEISLKYEPVLMESAASITLGNTKKLNRADLVAAYMADAFEANPEQECFYVIMLDRKHQPKGRHCITKGTQTCCMAHPREVFRAAVLAGACAVICVHNHPSGDPAPSVADVLITRQLREGAKAIDIDLLDHVICGTVPCDPAGRGHYSFREAGLC